MELYYDEEEVGDGSWLRSLSWLEDIGARPLTEAGSDEEGFLFTATRSDDGYRRLIAGRPHLDDQAGDRLPLLHLDRVLERMDAAGLALPTLKTWRLEGAEEAPADLRFPVFLQRSDTLLAERAVARLDGVQAFRAALRAWRARHGGEPVLARSWIEAAGPAQPRLRIWLVDQRALGWSWEGGVRSELLPPTPRATVLLARSAARLAGLFGSRLIAVDFVRLGGGAWVLLDAGLGSCAVTLHERLFKAIGARLLGRRSSFRGDEVSGCFGGG